MESVQIGHKLYRRSTLSETLESIKRLLSQHWVQGRYGIRDFPHEGFCLVGAARAIDGVHEPRVLQLFRRTRPKKFLTIEAYNDAQGRTKEQIMDFMDCCIREATPVVKRPAVKHRAAKRPAAKHTAKAKARIR